MSRRHLTHHLAQLLAVALLGGCHSVKVEPDRQLDAYDDAPWAAVLAGSVRDGNVDYETLRERHAGDLDRYLDAVRRFGPRQTPDQFETGSDELAYYLNAYNALMLRKWLDEKAGTDEKDRKVGLQWFVIDNWRVENRWVSLHSLENDWIRKRYDEPRIHFALVCGANSCPPLLDEPFDGTRLDDQLETLGRRWLREEPDGLVVDEDGKARFSQIFMWYLDDFDGWGGNKGVVERYLDPDDPRRVAALESLERGDAEWLPYDWRINDARIRSASPPSK